MSGSNFTPRDMRDALSNFATGVTIVTAVDQDENPIGMTASSFNSVSMDPPLILWSVTKTALSAKGFHDASHFGVHVLDAGQTDLSNAFARSGEDKFANVDFKLSAQKIPQIPGALTRFDCETYAIYEGGDHWIIVGKVLEIETTKGQGLVFSQGSYATASPIQMRNQSGQDVPQEDGEIDQLLLYHLSRAYHQLSQDFYVAVRESGISVPEWRVLASLHGRATHELAELSARTFVDNLPLQDLVLKMQDEDLCTVQGRGAKMKITGTEYGQSRVEHLFKLAKKQEAKAVGEDNPAGVTALSELLMTLVKNTNR
ncbi:flavin reductase family protein [Paramylibacter kogurei]|nr:flavin reductase family protein [Amylibacter kogurei]